MLAIPLPHFSQIPTKYLYPFSQLGSKGRFILQPISLLFLGKWGRGRGIVTLQFPSRTVISRWNMELIFHPSPAHAGKALVPCWSGAALVGWSRSWVSIPTSQHPLGARWPQAEYSTLCSSVLWKTLLRKRTNRPQAGRKYFCNEHMCI